jgi:hypothetical protein
MAMAEPERVHSGEAMRITGLPERTLQSLSARGEIWGAAKLGRRWTYDRQRLRAWVVANENAVASRADSIGEPVFSMHGSRSTDGNIDDRLRRLIDEKRSGGSATG